MFLVNSRRQASNVHVFALCVYACAIVQKINEISATSGVQASSTGDYKILLKDADGDDIVVINTSDRTDINIQAVGIDSLTPSGYNKDSAVNGTGKLTLTAAETANDTAAVRGNLKLSSNNDFKITQTSYQVDNSSNLTGFDEDVDVVINDGSTSLTYTCEADDGLAEVVAGLQDLDGYDDFGFGIAANADGTSVDITWSSAGAQITDEDTLKVGDTSASWTTVETDFFTPGETSAPLINVSTVSVLTQISASNSLAIIDGAIEKVSSVRGSLGTLQNRLEYTVSNLLKVTEFTTAARSRIADADFAAETARLAKAQVLQQAGASMLSQANASTDTVLQLLRG